MKRGDVGVNGSFIQLALFHALGKHSLAIGIDFAILERINNTAERKTYPARSRKDIYGEHFALCVHVDEPCYLNLA